MEEIIHPVNTDVLLCELTKDKFVRFTNYGENEIYIFSNIDSPNLMNEVGRLREVAFREAGGGTGKAIDVDEYDVSEKGFKQLIVWDPHLKEIVGGYRFIHGKDIEFAENGKLTGSTASLFDFSENFIKNYLPYSIELGRSFVQPKYQAAGSSRKGIFSLDNLWDGLGAVIVDNPDVKYFFGKFTMYTHFNTKARDLLLHFLKKYFPNKDNLARPYYPIAVNHETAELDSFFNTGNYMDDRKILMREMKLYGEGIPPLVNAYMNLSSTMQTFGTAVNNHFGGVEETGILVVINDIYPSKKHRHITTYTKSSFNGAKALL